MTKRLMAVALTAISVILAGCSSTIFRETYDAGDIAEREAIMRNWLMRKQASFGAEQVDGAYNVALGESTSVDPAVAQSLQTLANAGIILGGLPQFRRAGAIAPISADQLSASGFAASPITAEQLGAIQAREETRRAIEELKAATEQLRLQTQAVHEAAAMEGAE